MLKFFTKLFTELSLDELYDILKLRQEVFVVEQDCPYMDTDDKDQLSYHVFGMDENKDILAYTRLVPRGISYPKYVSIGRVVTSEKVRGIGEGKRLMENSIIEANRIWPNQPIKISAQTYLLKFYNELGFVEIGDGYLEDNIPHIAMIRE